MLLRLVDTRFQGLFTPLAGVLFAFPSWYWFTIGRQVVFRLGRWSSQIPTGLLEPRGTQEPARRFDLFAYGAITLYGRPFQTALLARTLKIARLFRFRSPLLSESRLISVPPATEMFQFTGFASCTLCIQVRILLAEWVSPFGHLRINARLPAPRSFSQAATSFIACNRQGIHHMHLVA